MHTIEELERYAKDHYIPIARKALVLFLIELVKGKGYKTVLECGSGIAYTSIQLALLDNVYVDTYEYYLPRFEIAKQNIKDFNLEEKIKISSEDIITAELGKSFDLIFIDGAKRHTVDHFNYLKDKLNEGGTIIVDDIDLKVTEKIERARKRLKYERAVRETKEFFENIKGYKATYMPIGDGIYVVNKE